MGWGQTPKGLGVQEIPWEGTVANIGLVVLILTAFAILALFEPWKWRQRARRKQRRERRREKRQRQSNL